MNIRALTKKKKLYLTTIISVIIIGASIIIGISFLDFESSENGIFHPDEFPDFITKNEDYFVSRIGDIPSINPNDYQLLVWGELDNPKSFTLNELRSLNLTERLLTTECIGNPTKGPLLSTTIWKGFLVYDLLTSLGLRPNATGVRYSAADGYYASHTLDQIKDNEVIGALYMNGETLPFIQGFPLRIVSPGAFGAKQPAWVIEMEVIARPLEDLYTTQGWDTSPPMDVDSTIFFPQNNVKVNAGIPFEIGGAAFGGTRISKVEYTINNGLNWSQVNIVKSVDLDYVWVFWNASITVEIAGNYFVYTKATDIYNNSQPKIDSNPADGSNSWPYLYVKVIES